MTSQPTAAAACLTCGRKLNVAGDRRTLDCGGDCRQCMAVIGGDPDCIDAIAGRPTREPEASVDDLGKGKGRRSRSDEHPGG